MAEPALRVVPLELGRLRTSLADLTGEPGTITLPVPGWLVEHRRGVVLFDTGMHVELQTSPGRLKELASDFDVDFPAGEELAARLGAAGYRPSDIDVAILSHLHFDHAGGVSALPDARIAVQREEWSVGHHPRLVEAGVYNPDDFDVGHAIQLLDGGHDLFGDGSIVCIPTPGHTKGHQALRLELPSGSVVLTADCVYLERMLGAMQTPRFAFDHQLQIESMRQIAKMRDEGCRVIFGHDLEQFRSLPPGGFS